jgi:NhaP-type Na+/H+ and K+/H+ antiporter
MKKVLYVVGAGLVVGAVAATLYYMNNKKKKASEEACEHKKFDDKFETENSESSKDVIIAQDEPVYEDVKSSAIGSMYSRHEGAANVMSDSVDAIRENIKVPEDTNAEIDDISAELDRMISED